MFILTDDAQSAAAFARYRAYLQEKRDVFPPSAFALATSGWYFDPSDPRCPHDAHLHSLTLAEADDPEDSDGNTALVSLRIRLKAWQGDGGVVEFYYPRLFSYDLILNREAPSAKYGIYEHADWRYNEFRVTDDGRLIHEIEWWNVGETGRWQIVSSDVQFAWLPPGEGVPG